eukprot:2869896-Rhodomonas_salina.5
MGNTCLSLLALSRHGYHSYLLPTRCPVLTLCVVQSRLRSTNLKSGASWTSTDVGRVWYQTLGNCDTVRDGSYHPTIRRASRYCSLLISLCTRFALSGTDNAYAATRLIRTPGLAIRLRRCYAVSGTDVAYADDQIDDQQPTHYGRIWVCSYAPATR